MWNLSGVLVDDFVIIDGKLRDPSRSVYFNPDFESRKNVSPWKIKSNFSAKAARCELLRWAWLTSINLSTFSCISWICNPSIWTADSPPFLLRICLRLWSWMLTINENKQSARAASLHDLCERYELKIDYITMDQVCTWSQYMVNILLYGLVYLYILCIVHIITVSYKIYI